MKYINFLYATALLSINSAFAGGGEETLKIVIDPDEKTISHIS